MVILLTALHDFRWFDWIAIFFTIWCMIIVVGCFFAKRDVSSYMGMISVVAIGITYLLWRIST